MSNLSKIYGNLAFTDGNGFSEDIDTNLVPFVSRFSLAGSEYLNFCEEFSGKQKKGVS